MAKKVRTYEVDVLFRMFEILQAAGEARRFADSCKGRFQIALDETFVKEAREAMDRVVPDLIAERPGYMSDVLGRDANKALAEAGSVTIETNGGTKCWACP